MIALALPDSTHFLDKQTLTMCADECDSDRNY